MKYPELINKVAEETNTSQVCARKVIGAFLETVKNDVDAGNEVMIVGFGKFKQITRAARMGTNPQTGGKMEIAESKAMVFKASKVKKDKTNA